MREMVEGTITLTGIVEKEGAQYVSYCRELGTSSCGDTSDEALINLGDAIEVHLNALQEVGELHKVLRERRIRIDFDVPLDELEIRVPPGKIFTTYQHKIQVAAAEAA